MHATTVGAALVLWIAVFTSSAPLAFLVLFVTGAQMSLLGALLTFATVPLFSVHEFTTAAWGLTWLQDQQLGGLVMWVPAGLLLTAYSTLPLAAALRVDTPARSFAKEKTA
jgi:putative membrane protein